MAAIHDLLKQITDPKLRERIAREWEDATRHKKFGLVYEQHLPEVVPIYSAKPRRGDLVAKRGWALTETWRVRRIEGGTHRHGHGCDRKGGRAGGLCGRCVRSGR